MSADGGPAFPAAEEWGADGMVCRIAAQGMTLRDYFAAVALQGMLAADRTLKFDAVEDAYNFADSMLQIRARRYV